MGRNYNGPHSAKNTYRELQSWVNPSSSLDSAAQNNARCRSPIGRHRIGGPCHQGRSRQEPQLVHRPQIPFRCTSTSIVYLRPGSIGLLSGQWTGRTVCLRAARGIRYSPSARCGFHMSVGRGSSQPAIRSKTSFISARAAQIFQIWPAPAIPAPQLTARRERRRKRTSLLSVATCR
jgi:hypothetical protein